MADRKIIKIGTKVVTRHGEAKVTGIELCQNGEKYGIDMDNGHWSYGYQVEVA